MIAQSEYLREDEVILALRSNLGHIGMSAEALGLSRGQLLDYIVRHPTVRQEREDLRKLLLHNALDEAEEILIDGMKTDKTLLMYFLNKQGKDRGYGTASQSGGNNTQVNVNINARALIAAMKDGAVHVEEDDEDINLFDEPRLQLIGSGSGGTGEVLPQSEVFHK